MTRTLQAWLPSRESSANGSWPRRGTSLCKSRRGARRALRSGSMWRFNVAGASRPALILAESRSDVSRAVAYDRWTVRRCRVSAVPRSGPPPGPLSAMCRGRRVVSNPHPERGRHGRLRGLRLAPDSVEGNASAGPRTGLRPRGVLAQGRCAQNVHRTGVHAKPRDGREGTGRTAAADQRALGGRQPTCRTPVAGLQTPLSNRCAGPNPAPRRAGRG